MSTEVNDHKEELKPQENENLMQATEQPVEESSTATETTSEIQPVDTTVEENIQANAELVEEVQTEATKEVGVPENYHGAESEEAKEEASTESAKEVVDNMGEATEGLMADGDSAPAKKLETDNIDLPVDEVLGDLKVTYAGKTLTVKLCQESNAINSTEFKRLKGTDSVYWWLTYIENKDTAMCAKVYVNDYTNADTGEVAKLNINNCYDEIPILYFGAHGDYYNINAGFKVENNLEGYDVMLDFMENLYPQRAASSDPICVTTFEKVLFDKPVILSDELGDASLNGTNHPHNKLKITLIKK